MKIITGCKRETCDIVRIAQRIENLKFEGKIVGFSKFCEGYNEAIDHTLELIKNEIRDFMETITRPNDET